MSVSSTPAPLGRSRRARARPSDPYRDMTTPKQAVIYLRVSTEEQGQGHSLDAQERECREFLGRVKSNWTLVGIFRDEHSGQTDQRPAFQEMMHLVHEGKANAIIAHRLDRFSRNLHQILTYFKELEGMGVVMAFAKDQFDFSTEEGRLQFHILAVFADWYLRNLSRETKKGKLARVLKGRHNNQPPIGYQITADGIALPDPESAEAILQAFQTYASGAFTDAKIADFLNQAGLRTRQGRAWSKDAVRELLQNEFYTGHVEYRGDLYPGEHQAIVSKELFDQVQQVRQLHARRPRSIGSTKRIYLLSALGRCAACGRTVRAQGKAGERYAYYRESSHLRGYSDCSDAGRGLRREMVEYQVEAILMRFVLPEAWRQEILAQLEHNDRAAQVVAERERLHRRLQRFGQLYVDGIYDRPTYEAERDAVREQMEALVVIEPENVLQAGTQLESLADVWPQASDEERQQICRLLFREVFIDFETRRITRILPHEDFVPLFHFHPFLSSEADGSYRVVLPDDVILAACEEATD